jgi:hypothetical protein
MDNSRAGRLGRIQLYDVTRTKVIRQLTSNELNQMAAQGLIGWFSYRGKVRACMQPVPMQSRTSNPIHSKVPLVQTDMELNAEGVFADAKGIGGVRRYGLNRFGAVDDSIVGNRVDQSMSKVEAWPEVYDRKNLTICAGRVHGVTEVSAEQLSGL